MVPTLRWVPGESFSQGHHEEVTEERVDFGLGLGMRSVHDAKVAWTRDVRREALKSLKVLRADLYARFVLATLRSYRDAQVFCSRVTGQNYCEIRGGALGQAHAAVFGGTSVVPSDTDNPTPIPSVPGGFVFWYTKPLERGGLVTGYETICRIAKPSDWAGDEAEARSWIDFVESEIDEVVSRLKAEDDPRKRYFDIRRIPDAANVRSLLGYSPLSYD